jgi:hypothetical protein
MNSKSFGHFSILPVEINYKILEDIDIDELLYRYRTNKYFMNFLTKHSTLKQLTKYHSLPMATSFEGFLESFNKKYITRNSPKYMSMEECFRRAAEYKNADLAKLFYEAGAENVNDLLAHSAETGNLETIKLSYQLGATNIAEAIDSAAKYGHLNIIKWIERVYDEYNQKIMSNLFGKWHIDYNQMLVNAAAGNSRETFYYAESMGADDYLSAFEAAIKNNNNDLAIHIYIKYNIANWDLIKAVVKHGNLDLYLWLVSQKLPELQNNNLLVKELAKKSRLDIIGYINDTTGLSQTEIDTILVYASIVNDTELILWAFAHGGQLYMFSLVYAIMRGNCEIQNYIIALESTHTSQPPMSHYIDTVINGGSNVYDSRLYRAYPDIMNQPPAYAIAYAYSLFIKTTTPYFRWHTGHR